MTHRPESTDLPNHHRQEHHERQDHAHHLHGSHHEHHHLHHHRHQQSEQDTHSEVKKGHLPGLDLTDNHGPENKTGQKPADGTKDSKHPTSHGEKLDDGTVKFSGLHGAAVDTDGSGAKNHREDRTRQNHTSLTKEDGKSLDTDKDKFVALPKSVMKEHGIKLGDHGFLERADTGEKVPVVFGDVSSGKQWARGTGQPEASVAALKALGFNDVNGARGVDKSVAFNLTMAPNSREQKGTMI